MALSLRFAEEADFSRAAREHLRDAAADGPVRAQTLVVALAGGPDRFLREFTADWHRVATLVVSNEPILDDADVTACVVLSKHAPGDARFGSALAVRAPVALPPDACWVWARALRQHVAARETFCLEAQPATAVFDSEQRGERFPLLRALATSAVTDADADAAYPVRTLEVPRFTSGVSAALLTLVVRCLAPLCPLLGLDRPLFFRPTASPAAPDEFTGLYT
ncbi:hypothetical protein PybrP1_010981 [[Pythium] brassicae (nom. inval.)]|nr:hypothetical protein PybrP1_010981 [[Pythium] brassicae (nom. inval.)]